MRHVPDLDVVRRENVVLVAGLGLFGVLLTAVVALALWQIVAMRERATRDPLTGLSNRRYADEVIPELVELHERKRIAGIAVVGFDLDHFKGVNDTWGHAPGDRVLRRLAHIMIRSARRADLLFRMGGEEFVAVLVEPSIEGARVFAERVRKAVEAIDDLTPIPPGRITISAGVARLHPGEDSDAVLARTDRLLYRAKDEGRNRVVTEEGVSG